MLLLPIILLLVLVLFVPLTSVVISSFQGESGEFTLSNYLSMSQKIYIKALKNSLLISISTTIIATFLGSILAYLIFRSSPRARSIMISLTTIPLTFSGIVVAFLFITTFGSGGTYTLTLAKLFGINPLRFSSFLFTWKGLVLAYSYFQIPRMAIVMIAAWATMDWSLVEAGKSLGASNWQILWRITLPYIKDSILGGSILLFAVSMGAFGTALALTGIGVNILPLTIYTQISDVSYNPHQADALAIVLTLVTTLCIYIYRRQFLKLGGES